MNYRAFLQSVVAWGRRRPKTAVLAGVGLVVLVAAILFSASGPPPQQYSYYQVKRGDLLISIVEGGTLDAVNQVLIRNEVEDNSRITFIVKEGVMVKQDDLLVELDSSRAQDSVNAQEIAVERAQFNLLSDQQNLEIQKSLHESEMRQAQLKVEFAESDLEKYIEGEMIQAQRNAQIKITNVLETLQINEERLRWSEELYAKGFETKANLDKDRLTVSQSKLSLEQAQRDLWLIEKFDQPKQRRRLEAALEDAKTDKERQKLTGERRLEGYAASVATSKRTLDLSKDKLERDKQQLAACKVYAPSAGMVVYGSSEGAGRWSSESMIEEGAMVRHRQTLIKLPDISEMKMLVKIHESRITQVTPGQQAFVVLDSMPDQRFNGVVNRVSPLPDSGSRYGNPNLKIYATEILITDRLPDVKPGVSARAEIIVTNLADTLYVPIQAVTTRKGKQVAFLAGALQQPVPISVGMFNTKFIQVTSGLKDGDQVLLSPPFDTEEKDLGGAIIADGEKPPPGTTNLQASVAMQSSEENGRGRFGRTKGGGEGEDASSGPRNGGGPRFGQGGRRMSDGLAQDAAQSGKNAAPGSDAGSGSTINPDELLKRFDVNKDGRLDFDEKMAASESFRQRRQGGTNAAPETGETSVERGSGQPRGEGGPRREGPPRGEGRTRGDGPRSP